MSTRAPLTVLTAVSKRGRAAGATWGSAVLEVTEGLDDGEVLPHGIDGQAGLRDPIGGDIAEELARLGEMWHLARFHLHDAGGRRVHGHHVLTEDQDTGRPGPALDGAVALHPHDSVDDGEAGGRQRAVDVHDALVDPG